MKRPCRRSVEDWTMLVLLFVVGALLLYYEAIWNDFR